MKWDSFIFIKVKKNVYFCVLSVSSGLIRKLFLPRLFHQNFIDLDDGKRSELIKSQRKLEYFQVYSK